MRILLAMIALVTLGACAHHKSCGDKAKAGHHMKKDMWEKAWKDMDTNNDGKLSKKEFTDFKVAKFTDMDTNKDGFVTMDEKKEFHKKMKKGKCKDCK
ncbi:MAG: hypothetical protein KDD33_00490 [Bdellovibrionales bacterium]|nr:hypothetical protein [Bdellovibrionales bacterium]